jgi:hypothetical protein
MEAASGLALGQAPSGDVRDCVAQRCRARHECRSSAGRRSLADCRHSDERRDDGLSVRPDSTGLQDLRRIGAGRECVEVIRWRRGGFTLREATAVVLDALWPACDRRCQARMLGAASAFEHARRCEAILSHSSRCHRSIAYSRPSIGCRSWLPVHAVPWGSQREGAPRALWRRGGLANEVARRDNPKLRELDRACQHHLRDRSLQRPRIASDCETSDSVPLTTSVAML